MKVFVDAGHNYSGADTGAQANGLKEQDVTYAVAQLLGDILISAGIQVKYSRDGIESNVGSSLTESINGRVRMTNDWNADLFVSLHCNASANATANGTETLIYSRAGQAETLANIVNSNLVALGLNDRGVKVRTDLGVLKNTNMPAVLIELAFITNVKDAIYLANRRTELANAVASAIFCYLEISPENRKTEGLKMIYNYIDGNMPEWAVEAVQWAVDNGIVKGGANGLNLDDQDLQTIVWIYRAQKVKN